MVKVIDFSLVVGIQRHGMIELASIILKIVPTAKTMAQLSKGVKREGSRIFAGRAIANAAVISKDIGSMLVQMFENTIVAKSLRGQGSDDLPAHFGLSDGLANGLVDGMASLIRSSVRIMSKTSGKSAVVKIRAIDKSWSDYMSLPGAQYLSQPSNLTIPVMRWMLIDPSIDIGQAAYQIFFLGEDGKMDTQIKKVSRSGRAIMLSLEALGGGGTPYVLPAIISGQAGKNFIELALGQPDVAEKAAKLLLKRIV
jgi:hypothetical protein